MTIALLATGDEIVHGDTLNTNCHHIAHTLSSEGLPLGLHISCSDKEAEIIDCLKFLASKHSIIIIIGGLGPTCDDLTRFALAKFTDEQLIIHQTALSHVQNLLSAAKVVMNEGNKQQALFPKNATILPNARGSAVGCSYQWQDKTFYLLPGPPQECLTMFNDYVFPELQKTHHSDKKILSWLLFGLAESEIAQDLETSLTDQECQTGYRLDTPYIEFKVRCKEELIPQINTIVEPIVKPHRLMDSNKKASSALYELILKIQEPISIVDEVTGGLLERLLNTPESHHLLHFNTLKRTKLHFHLSGLEEYWSGKSISGLSQIVIHFHDESQEGKETHVIPYRSPNVVHYAAEWLSFRLFHLINQLHQ